MYRMGRVKMISLMSSLIMFLFQKRMWRCLQCSKRHQVKVVARRCCVKKVFLKISPNSQESTCARVSFLIKLQAATLLKKRLWHSYFPVNFLKFLRTPFLTEHVWWLLLDLNHISISKNCQKHFKSDKFFLLL